MHSYTYMSAIHQREYQFPLKMLQFEFVPQDIEESEFLDSVDFGGAAFSVETVIYTAYTNTHIFFYLNTCAASRDNYNLETISAYVFEQMHIIYAYTHVSLA